MGDGRSIDTVRFKIGTEIYAVDWGRAMRLREELTARGSQGLVEEMRSVGASSPVEVRRAWLADLNAALGPLIAVLPAGDAPDLTRLHMAVDKAL